MYLCYSMLSLFNLIGQLLGYTVSCAMSVSQKHECMHRHYHAHRYIHVDTLYYLLHAYYCKNEVTLTTFSIE